MTDSTSPRPALTVVIPRTLHGMSDSEKRDALDSVQAVLKREVRNLEVMNLLGSFFEEARKAPQWQRMKLDFDSHGVAGASLLVNPHPDDENEGWVAFEPGVETAEEVQEMALEVGAELTLDEAQALVDAGSTLSLASAETLKAMEFFGSQLHEAGLSREEVASPGLFLFPNQAQAIAAWERAHDLDMELPGSAPAKGSGFRF